MVRSRRPDAGSRQPERRLAASSNNHSKPLALVGFMGSGKTVVGALVAERSGVPFFDLDHMIEHEAGMSIAEIFATSGEPAFRALEKRVLPRALQRGAVVALGGGVADGRR